MEQNVVWSLDVKNAGKGVDSTDFPELDRAQGEKKPCLDFACV